MMLWKSIENCWCCCWMSTLADATATVRQRVLSEQAVGRRQPAVDGLLEQDLPRAGSAETPPLAPWQPVTSSPSAAAAAHVIQGSPLASPPLPPARLSSPETCCDIGGSSGHPTWPCDLLDHLLSYYTVAVSARFIIIISLFSKKTTCQTHVLT